MSEEIETYIAEEEEDRAVTIRVKNFAIVKTDKTPYSTDLDQIAHNYSLLGATHDDLAYLLKVSRATITKWMNRYESFDSAIQQGRIFADGQVAHSLYRKAIGFERDEIELKLLNNGDGTNSVHREEVKRFYPADTSAAIYWLKTRQPNLWRDKSKDETGDNTQQIFIINGQQIIF